MITLPTIAIPKYRMVIPSTSAEIEYRPYLVKEEKILMIALETEDSDTIEDAIINIISECISYNKNIRDLPSYDIEFMFLRIRSKSVGDKVELVKICSDEECKEHNDITILLSDSVIKNNDKKDCIIKLSDDLSIELKFPSIGAKITQQEGVSDSDVLITNAALSLAFVYSGDEVYDAKDTSLEERIKFIEQLNTNQFGEVIEFLLDIPYVGYDGVFTCKKCGKETEYSYAGLIDFFI